MSDKAGADYQRKLDEVSARFLVRTAEGLQDAIDHVAQARQGNVTALQAIIMIVHRASGSGGMLGFPQISHLAGELEVHLRTVKEVGIDPAGWHELEQQLRSLQAAVSAEQQTRACD